VNVCEKLALLFGLMGLAGAGVIIWTIVGAAIIAIRGY